MAEASTARSPVAEPGWIHKLDAIGPVVAFAFGAFWINGFLVVPAALRSAVPT